MNTFDHKIAARYKVSPACLNYSSVVSNSYNQIIRSSRLSPDSGNYFGFQRHSRMLSPEEGSEQLL
jgi:hypothetical protein